MARPRKQIKSPAARRHKRVDAVRRKVPRQVREVQMLDVAGAIFAKRGYHAASMDEIAAAAGITKPMLYAYFTSKEGLYLATIERVGDHLMESVQPMLGVSDPVERLRSGARTLFAFIDRHRDGWAVMYNEAIAGSSPVAKQVALFRQQLVAAIANGISDLSGYRDSSGLRAPEPLAHALMGAGEALAQWWLRHPEQTVDDMVERLMMIAHPLIQPVRGTKPVAVSVSR